MHLLDLTLPTLAENLALDEALLLDAEASKTGEVLRFWEWPAFAVVLGAGCRLAADLNEAACRDDGVAILRRASGGGTVLLGPGCLLYSLILAFDRSPLLAGIISSYGYILDRNRAALAEAAPGIGHAGTSDLAMGGQKFSGSAQQRKRHYLLHHGTLLYGFAIPRISSYLHMPASQPDYRQQRTHEAFLTNIPLDSSALKACLRRAWGVNSSLEDLPRNLVSRLVAEKYATQEWIRRR
jgi:lipoate-protein ligase A